jgi:4-amino-4-deoxy-L-arabinose transferase-like glycosyltransferase
VAKNTTHKLNHHLPWLTITAVLTLLFLTVAAANLPNYFPVSADDGWIMSASYKLSNEGIFGSDLYSGFFNAEKHYFIALPVYHFLQAAALKLFGFGIAQARLPNLASAILLIAVTTILAYRHYSRPTALLTAALLILWRSNLTATEPRVPLLAYAQSGRYDLTAAALVWTAVLLLDELLRRPRPLTALILGITAGLAALTQFFGSFILLPVAAALMLKWGKQLLKQRITYLFAAGFLLVTLPYAIYTLAHFDDFTGQSVLKQGRTQFLEPSFYIENILDEPRRLGHLFLGQRDALLGRDVPLRPFGPWLLSLTLMAAVLYLLKMTLSGKIKSLPLPWFSALSFALALTLFDQTKAPVYAILLLPGLCLALAAFSTAVIQRLRQMNRPLPTRLAAIAPVLILLAVLLLEGANSHRRQLSQAQEVSPYLAVTARIENALSPGAVLLGSERWWPGLKDYPYLSPNGLWARWKLDDEDGRSPQFVEQVQATAADFIIVNNNVRGDLGQHSEQLQSQFWDYLAQCTTLAADWTDVSYGRIEIYQLSDIPNC